MRKINAEKAYQWLSICVITVISLLSLYPLLYVVSMSLVHEQEWIKKGGFILWPDSPTLIAYKRLFNGPIILHALGISVLKTIVGTIVVIVMTTITAYAVSRSGLPGGRLLLFGVVVTILFNGGLVPTYLVIKELHLLNSFWVFVIPVAIDSWSVLVLKQFFANIPKEIEESARMDGIGEFNLMIRIMVPMAAPALAAISLFSAVGHWNSWFDALMYIDERNLMPLQLILRNMFVNPQLGFEFNPSQLVNPTQRVSMESLKMAVAVIGTLPILCVYPFLQKYFTKGMYLGAVKG
ncbi:carbohydrate ABC transporter permease [Paenibacillus eucommiae]|uniref:Aldouronate transport system permease protein n=1 Tax=Paenibacillus eucommiae TaxID=1355755 RepID=A0ABS4IZ76_9BACL|nr:carbohydrate ABC transporter permease [Paenibacillus eucommiae]MBP1992266.1 putative aldouronate transport system permease protein [Paenibacillus eucommiae]